MSAKNETYGKYKDETDEEYYCPINSVADDHIVSARELDDCVEVSTAGRYSGNINIVGSHPNEKQDK